MTADLITDDAVEAAERALYAAEYDDPDSVTEAEWAMVSDAEREFYMSSASAALTAAAPLIAAQATAERERFEAVAEAAADVRAGQGNRGLQYIGAFDRMYAALDALNAGGA